MSVTHLPCWTQVDIHWDQVIEKINEYAKKKGVTPIDISIQWLFNNKAVHSIVAGPDPNAVEIIFGCIGLQIYH